MIPPAFVEIRQPMSKRDFKELKEGAQKEAELPIP